MAPTSCLLGDLHFAIFGMKSSSWPLLQAGVGRGTVPQGWSAGGSLETCFFFPPGKHVTQECCRMDGRMVALDLAAWPWEGHGNGDSSLQPGTSMYGTSPKSPSPLQAGLSRRDLSPNLGWFSQMEKLHPSPSPQPIGRFLLVSVGCACRPLVTLPEMRLHQLPALKYCII